MPADIIATIACAPTARSVVVTVPLSPAQVLAVTYDWVIEVSPDNGAHWFFAASNGYQPDPTNRDGTPRTQHQFGAASSGLPLPPTHVRVRLINSSDPTLAPTLEAA